MLFLTKYESNLILHGFCSPSHYNWWRGKVTLYEDLPKFCGDNIFFWHLWQDKPLWVELKINGGVIFITILLHFHYFISLEKANTQKNEVFHLKISSEMWMHQLLLDNILKFTISVLTVPSAVYPLCSIFVNNT